MTPTGPINVQVAQPARCLIVVGDGLSRQATDGCESEGESILETVSFEAEVHRLAREGATGCIHLTDNGQHPLMQLVSSLKENDKR